MFRKEKYLMMIERSPAPVWGFDMCIAENEVWVFHGKLNALFRFDMKTEEMKYILSVPELPMMEKILFTAIKYWKKKIFLFPYNALTCIVYETETGRIHTMDVKGMMLETVFGEGRYVYGKPLQTSQPLVKIDLEKECIVKGLELSQSEEIQYTNDICYLGNEKYAGVLTPGNQFFILDTRNDTIQLGDIPDKEEEYCTIEAYNDELYFGGYRKNKVIKVNWKNGKIIKQYGNLEQYGRFVGRWGEEILIDRTEQKEIYRWNVLTGEIKEFAINEKKRDNKQENYWYCYGIFKNLSDGKAYYMNRYNNTFAVWTDISEIRSYEWKISEEDKDELEEKMICNQKDSIQENAIFTLEDYVRVIKGM